MKANNIKTLSGHTDCITSLCYSFNDKKILSGSSDKTIKIWDEQTESNIKTFYGHNDSISSLYYSFDDKKIVSGSSDKTIKIWDE